MDREAERKAVRGARSFIRVFPYLLRGAFFFRQPSFMFLKPPRAEFLKSFSPFPLSNVRPFLFVFRLPQDAGSRL